MSRLILNIMHLSLLLPRRLKLRIRYSTYAVLGQYVTRVVPVSATAPYRSRGRTQDGHANIVSVDGFAKQSSCGRATGLDQECGQKSLTCPDRSSIAKVGHVNNSTVRPNEYRITPAQSSFNALTTVSGIVGSSRFERQPVTAALGRENVIRYRYNAFIKILSGAILVCKETCKL